MRRKQLKEKKRRERGQSRENKRMRRGWRQKVREELTAFDSIYEFILFISIKNLLFILSFIFLYFY